MGQPRNRLIYRKGNRSLTAIEEEIDRLWEQAQKEGRLGELSDNRRQEAITLEADDGIIVEAIAVVVYFRSAINTIAIDIWREFILPRLKKRWGEDILVEERDNESE